MCGCEKKNNVRKEDMVVHHIYPNQKHIPFEDCKFVCLCKRCHTKIHNNKIAWDYWTEYFIELIEKYMDGVCYI